MGQFIDFAYIKQHADFAAVLAHYDIIITGDGDELRCCCPFHDDDRPSMTINHDKSVFNCPAASCGENGNILDFVANMEKAELRPAAITLASICKIALANNSRNQKEGCSASRSSERGSNKLTKSVKATPKSKSSKKPDAEGNTPLSFSLTLDPEHPYGESRSLSPPVIERFEMGYCNRGSMSGRWCVPIHNVDGEVVAYIGRHAATTVSKDTEKYKLPKEFKKNLALFNLHRVKHSEHVVLVEGVFDTIRLHELGLPTVGLFGTSVSDAQLVLLTECGVRLVYSLLDAGSEKAERKLVHRVSREIFVRTVSLPDGEDPATVSADFLREHVPLFEK